MVKRSDGRWQEVLTVNGKRKYFYGKTKSEVLRKIQNFREEESKGKYFPDVADEWWKMHEPTVVHNTAKGYKPAVERARGFFPVPIKTIKPTDVSKAMQRFIRLYKPAKKTANNQLMILNSIFKYAVTQGYIDFNPAREVSVPKNLPKKKRGVPSNSDIEKVKQNTDLPFGMFAYWALYTGLRRGELLALTWEDVDIENRAIRVNKSLYHKSNRPYIKKPKTEAGERVVPILDRLAERITPGKGIIFHRNGQYMSNHIAINEWKRYQEATGISCTPHELRHAYATMLYEAGIEPKDAQALLGHAQLSTTMDIYTSVREERQQQVKNKILCVDFVSRTA